MKTKPVKIAFLSRAGNRIRLPKIATKPVKISFITKAKLRRRKEL